MMKQTVKELIEQRKEYFNNCYKDKTDLIAKDILFLDEILQTYENKIAEKDKELEQQIKLCEWYAKKPQLFKEDFEKNCIECKVELSEEELKEDNYCYSCGAEISSYSIRFKDNSDYEKLLSKEENKMINYYLVELWDKNMNVVKFYTLAELKLYIENNKNYPSISFKYKVLDNELNEVQENEWNS